MTVSSPSLRPKRRFHLRLQTKLLVAVLLLAISTFVRAPGSVPRGWQYTYGSISSSVGIRQHGSVVFYSTIQYLALGYSYEITSHRPLLDSPDIGSGTYKVAFWPENPNQAKLISETPPNYFAVLFPLAAALLLATEVVVPTRRWAHNRLEHAIDKGTAKAIAKAEREAAEAEAAEAAAIAANNETSTPTPPSADEVVPAEPPQDSVASDESEAQPAAPEAEMATSEPSDADAEPLGSPEEAAGDEEVVAEAPPPKRQPIKPKPSAPKNIYIPQITDVPETEPDRSAAGLKSKLKAPKPAATKPRKKSTTTAKKATAKKTVAKKPAAKKATAKKKTAKPRTTMK